jgi:hypothetical protein
MKYKKIREGWVAKSYDSQPLPPEWQLNYFESFFFIKTPFL